MALETDEVTADWDGVAPAQKGGGRRQNDGLSLFMKLEPRPGKPYVFRPACAPISFRKHRWAFRTLKQWPISPATDIKDKDLDIAWSQGKYSPAVSFAAFVFDRENGNRLRILEAGSDVFGPIGNHAHLCKINPASPTKGLDWVVEVSKNDEGNWKYMVTMDVQKGPTPFTAEEIKALENPKFQREELEKKYFVKSTPEEIKDLWEQLPESMRVNTPRDGKGKGQANYEKKPEAQKVAQAPVASKPAQVPVEKPKAEAKPEQKVASAPAKDDGFLSDPDESANDNQDGGPSEVDDDQPAKLF